MTAPRRPSRPCDTPPQNADPIIPPTFNAMMKAKRVQPAPLEKPGIPVGHRVVRHHETRSQHRAVNGGAKQIALEDARQRDSGAACCRVVASLPHRQPHRTFSHLRSNPQHEKGRNGADPEHRPPGLVHLAAQHRIQGLKHQRLTGCSPTPMPPAGCPLRRLEDDRAGARAPAACPPPIRPPSRCRTAPGRRRAPAYDVENPLSTVKSENQIIESTSGNLRPHRSAAVPATAPPTRRNINVTVPSAPASALSTVKLRWISASTNVRIVKSKPSSIQPKNAAENARFCG